MEVKNKSLFKNKKRKKGGEIMKKSLKITMVFAFAILFVYIFSGIALADNNQEISAYYKALDAKRPILLEMYSPG